jgi:PadR family transcriptional regulator PadR
VGLGDERRLSEVMIVDSRLLSGAVEMLMLEVISHGPTYGYEITQTVESRSQGYFELKEGSLYPALHRLEEQKLVKSSWQEVDGRRRKYYELTTAGRKALAVKKTEWKAFASGIQGILGGSDSASVMPVI